MLLETRRVMVHQALAVAIRADDVRYIQQRFVLALNDRFDVFSRSEDSFGATEML